MNEVESAWFAGIFEGEGCLAINKGDDRWWRLVIQMTDQDVVEKAQRIIRAGTIRTPTTRESHHKKSWELTVYKREDLIRILEQIRPHLGVRRGAKADQALDALRRHGANG